jgi:RNA polymerase sigma-70 factor (ECF subfamily)
MQGQDERVAAELERFLSAFAEPPRGSPAVLSRWLSGALDTAAQAFPDLDLEAGEFAQYLGEKAAAARDETRLDELHVPDLYLAWACARRDPAALAIFEHEHMRRVHSLARGTDADELVQRVRVRLLAADTPSGPRIRQYSGRGPLAAWVRMVATRLAIDAARSGRAGDEHRDLGDANGPADPELDYLKSRYAGAFHAALERALCALSPKERALLRLCYVDDAAPSSIAGMYNVSVRTVQRWLVDARARVLEQTRAHLTETLAVRGTELESLLELMKSRMHVTLQRVLEPPRGRGPLEIGEP